MSAKPQVSNTEKISKTVLYVQNGDTHTDFINVVRYSYLSIKLQPSRNTQRITLFTIVQRREHPSDE